MGFRCPPPRPDSKSPHAWPMLAWPFAPTLELVGRSGVYELLRCRRVHLARCQRFRAFRHGDKRNACCDSACYGSEPPPRLLFFSSVPAMNRVPGRFHRWTGTQAAGRQVFLGFSAWHEFALGGPSTPPRGTLPIETKPLSPPSNQLNGRDIGQRVGAEGSISDFRRQVSQILRICPQPSRKERDWARRRPHCLWIPQARAYG